MDEPALAWETGAHWDHSGARYGKKKKEKNPPLVIHKDSSPHTFSGSFETFSSFFMSSLGEVIGEEEAGGGGLVGRGDGLVARGGGLSARGGGLFVRGGEVLRSLVRATKQENGAVGYLLRERMFSGEVGLWQRGEVCGELRGDDCSRNQAIPIHGYQDNYRDGMQKEKDGGQPILACA